MNKSALKCDSNQNTTFCEKNEKTEEVPEIPSIPSKLKNSLASLLPSNFLNLPPRWKDWFVRGQSGILLISCFYTVVNLGPWGLFCLTILVQVSSFYELMRLGQSVTNVENMKVWSCCLFLLGNFYHLDPMLSGLLPINSSQRQGLCFMLYLLLITWFVLSIRNTSDCLTRYCLLAWCHMATFYIVGAGYLMNITLQHGMVWYIFSMSIITINDIFAYMCGFFLGSTPLIVLSPKKTVEGFIGGGLITILTGPLFANFLQNYSFLTSNLSNNQGIAADFYFGGLKSPFVYHCGVISVFASTFGPVAGFFCSGFKRGCNQKNFGCLIPGHGGVLDRCDCMFLMAAFTYFYLQNFVLNITD